MKEKTLTNILWFVLFVGFVFGVVMMYEWNTRYPKFKDSTSVVNVNQQETKLPVKTESSYVGKYEFGTYYEDCTNIDLSDENHYRIELELTETGEYNYSFAVSCGNVRTSSGKYYIYGDTIALINQNEIDHPTEGTDKLSPVVYLKALNGTIADQTIGRNLVLKKVN